jgi:hypothetical protein
VELALSAVVKAGRDPASITSLGCLFEPGAFETALRRYLNKDEQQTPRPTAHNIASTLIGLARRYLGSDASALDQLAELARLRKCLGPRPKGLTKKNRNLLRALDDPGLRAKLHFLPERLANWAERTTPTRGAAAYGRWLGFLAESAPSALTDHAVTSALPAARDACPGVARRGWQFAEVWLEVWRLRPRLA